jgi:lipopolysaccharide export system protein LptC
MTDVHTHPRPTRSYWATSRRNSDHRFRRARSHSRLVRALRILIPAGVITSFVIVILMTYFNPLRMIAKLPINLDGLVVSGTKITMEQPRLSGFTRDSRPYELSAVAAAQDMTQPDVVELRDLRAKLAMQDNNTLEMSAVSGIYNNKSEFLKLERNIQILSTGGYQGYLSEATIDIRKGQIVSDKPVKLKMLQGTLDANKLEIVDSGNLVRFLNGVAMDLMLPQNAATATQEAKAN